LDTLYICDRMGKLDELIRESRLGSEDDSDALLESYGLYPYSSIHLVARDQQSARISHRSALLSSDMAWVHSISDNEITTQQKQEIIDLSPEIDHTIIETSSELAIRNEEPVMKSLVNEVFVDLDTEDKQIVDIASDVETEILDKVHIIEKEEDLALDIRDKEDADSLLVPDHKKNKKNKKKQSFKLRDLSGLSTYTQWLMSLNDPDFHIKKERADEKARKRKIESDVMKSVQKSEEIISESLAVILAVQGHRDDAKKMYTQLMHKFPEKSSYFAAKIENL
jgi:hypothetical protein